MLNRAGVAAPLPHGRGSVDAEPRTSVSGPSDLLNNPAAEKVIEARVRLHYVFPSGG